jgi:hypothetical protein
VAAVVCRKRIDPAFVDERTANIIERQILVIHVPRVLDVQDSHTLTPTTRLVSKRFFAEAARSGIKVELCSREIRSCDRRPRGLVAALAPVPAVDA